MKTMGKTIGLAALLAAGLACLAACGGEEGLWITAGERPPEATGPVVSSTVQYQLPQEGDTLVVLAQRLEGERVVEEETLAQFTQPQGEVSVDLSFLPGDETKGFTVQWTLSGPGQDQSLVWQLPQGAGYLAVAWTQGDQDWYAAQPEQDPQEGIILACLGAGDLEKGLPALACAEFMATPSHAQQYQQVHLIRVMVREGTGE